MVVLFVCFNFMTSSLCSHPQIWLIPYFLKGYKKVLTEDDLYKNRGIHDSEMLGNKLEHFWNKKKSLGKALIAMFLGEFLRVCFLSLISETCKMIQPFLLLKLLNIYDENRSSENMMDIYICAILLVLFLLLGILNFHYFAFSITQLGMKVRIACSSLIYRKALRLNQTALTKTSPGQIVNLLSNDVTKLEYMNYLNILFFAPTETVVVMVLIYVTVGWYGLLGAGCFLISLFLTCYCPPLPYHSTPNPIQDLRGRSDPRRGGGSDPHRSGASDQVKTFLGKIAGNIRFSTAKIADKRISLLNEILSGIEVVKMFAWEKFVGNQVEATRKREIQQLTRNSIVRGLSIFTPLAFAKFAIFSAVVLYVLTGNVLKSSYVFTLIAFYSLLQTATIYFPTGAASLAEMMISTKRIEEYLCQEEYATGQNPQKPVGVVEKPTNFHNSLEISKVNGEIELIDVSAKWPNSATHSIRNISIKIPSGELTTIIGSSGCGKTTLLNVILQELSPHQGSVKVSGTISYAPQEPWLFGETLRDNILFGEPFIEKKYTQVVKVCALERDFKLFQYGDGTLTRDRGLSLSGGQKARINLARAIYRDADIYLLDDPLSAVDNRVGKHIFELAILDYLRNKTVVLITHQMQYLKNVNSIHLLKEGSLEHFTSYSQLKEYSKKYFNELDDVLNQGQEQNEDVGMEGEIESKNVADLPQKLMKEEKREGKISGKVYKMYLSASGHWFRVVLMISLFVIAQAFDSISDYFLSYWINIEQDKQLMEKTTQTVLKENVQLNETLNNNQLNWFIGMIFGGPFTLVYYTTLVLLFAFFALTRSIYFYLWCVRISEKMHRKMFNKVFHSPMQFFNQNPAGRILNRFSKDIGTLDDEILGPLMDSLRIGMTMISIYITIGIVDIWTLVPSVAIFCLCFCMQNYYLETSRDITRIESINRGPMYTHLTQSLQGMTVIRTFNVGERFKKEFHLFQNVHSSAFFMSLASSRTYGFWMDLLSCIYVACVMFFLLIIKKESFGGNVGFAISQALGLTQSLQRGMRQWGTFQNQMISVERIQEYIDLEQEMDNKKQPSKEWLQEGKIEYKEVSLKYSKDSYQVLTEVNISIEPKEKIGIVGRTGAGKSSLLRVLLRLVDFDGSVFIDGVNCESISLQALRTKISVISQVPLLFSGSLRNNLDPFEEHNDEILWKALEEVDMKHKVENLPNSLNMVIAEGGSNFSIGERQLLCLARAIINHNKILFLDEATSNVDPQTDELIQKTIRLKFSDCTVLTIAHRLQTVMNSDRVLVMDNGKVVEFDSPDELLKKKDGYFYSLVTQSVEEDNPKHLRN